MKILVCGGRDFTDYGLLCMELDKIKDVDLVIQGGARGADNWTKQWAESRSILTKTFKADWNQFDKKAGYLRNKRMLDEGKPDLVIAFPGGKGTANMVKIARDAGVQVKIVEDSTLDRPATGF